MQQGARFCYLICYHQGNFVTKFVTFSVLETSWVTKIYRISPNFTPSEKKHRVMEKVKMPRVRFVFDRKKTANKTDKKGLIEIEVYHDGKRAMFSTGVKVYQGQWKKDMIVGRQDCIDLNRFINSIKSMLQKEIDSQYEKNQRIDFDKLRALFSNRKDNSLVPDFLSFMQKRMRERPMSEGTWKGHRSIYHVLKEWGRIKTFEDLTPCNIQLWNELSIKNSKSGKPNPNYHKVLKIYVREYINFYQTHLPKDFQNPYDGFKVKRDKTIKHAFLTSEELQKWRKVKLSSSQAEKARDIFVFCCYTGLSFADYQNFKPRLIFENNGGLRYVNDRVKSGERFNITILKPAKQILDKYNGELPKMDAHVYNRYLKDIALLCGISKVISSHCARVTFASTVLLANGFGLKTIASALGHANTRQTEEYSKLTPRNVDRSFDELNERL